ncbi:hypothetical protein BX666DRAFT_2027503 [Dichotomocladium elegans]|nr:hypothetical protein BX666DRAFT_2027503 [Dichotomocladium elegans]
MDKTQAFPQPEISKQSIYTLVYMSICLSCVVWQLVNSTLLVYRSRKILHFAVLAEVILAFIVILASLLNPLIGLDCVTRYWISITCVNIAGILIQSILLYKAYICNNRARWLLGLGSAINCGYLVLLVLYSVFGQVPFTRDSFGNCLMDNFEWPAIAKLSLDIFCNLFLSTAFLMVIYRYYRHFGNSLYKSLLSSGTIYIVGVVAINIIVGLLIAFKAVGGLSSDLYSFEWVVTGYLLIKQFKHDKEMSEAEEEETGSKTAHSDAASIISHRNETPGHMQYGFEFLTNTIPRYCHHCSNLIQPDNEK